MKKNWQTTVSGIGGAITTLLTLVALAPYQLGELGAVIPPEWKANIAIAGLIASFILKVWNSVAAKDAQ